MSSRTSTGPTTQRSTSSACSEGGSSNSARSLELTYRADELQRTHPLRIALGDLATAAGIVRHLLHRSLSPEAVEELAAPHAVSTRRICTRKGRATRSSLPRSSRAGAARYRPPTARRSLRVNDCLDPKARGHFSPPSPSCPSQPSSAPRGRRQRVALMPWRSVKRPGFSGPKAIRSHSGTSWRAWSLLSIDPHHRVDRTGRYCTHFARRRDGRRDLARLAHHAEAGRRRRGSARVRARLPLPHGRRAPRGGGPARAHSPLRRPADARWPNEPSSSSAAPGNVTSPTSTTKRSRRSRGRSSSPASRAAARGGCGVSWLAEILDPPGPEPASNRPPSVQSRARVPAGDPGAARLHAGRSVRIPGSGPGR